MRRLKAFGFVIGLLLLSSCGRPEIGTGNTASPTRIEAPITSVVASPQQSPSCPGPGPSPRLEVGAAYDPIRKVTVVFGGDLSATPSTSTTPTSETWTFDGHCWLLLHPAARPSARQALGGLVFDPAIGKTLLVGGRGVRAYPADAWLWDGTNWTQLSGAPRFGNVDAIYDTARKVVVVYGEFTSSGNPLDSVDHFTWTWDGTTWLRQAPTHMPPPRSDAQMCFDDSTKTALLLGGATSVPQALGDTWEWNGSDWIQDQPVSSPPARFSATLVCGNGRVVLAGGAAVNTAPFADVWTWDGNTWSQLQSAHVPEGLLGAGGAFDGTYYFVVLGAGATTPARAEVWAFDGTDWAEVALS